MEAQGGGGSALFAAVNWGEQLLMGALGTSVAVLAIAFVGLGMLRGRISPRHCFQIVLGCFVLFGAPAIASGIVRAAASGAGGLSSVDAPPVNKPTLPQKAPEFDPYAGAALPAD